MITSFTGTETKVKRATSEKKKQNWIFVAQLITGAYIVGQATNPSRRLAAINSGYNKAIPDCLQIYRIVGVQPETEDRTLISVVKKLCDRFGDERIIAL